MKNILLTGFQPFGGLTDNPSARIVYVMDGAVINRHRVVAHTLPVTFKDAPVILERLLVQFEPKLVMCLGLAVGEEVIRLERQAINQVDFRIADNAGQIVKGPVVQGGPQSYQSRLPLDSIREALHRHHIPARISNCAGTFVCNALMYSALNLCTREDDYTACGFIHLPCLPEQTRDVRTTDCQFPDVKADSSAFVGMDGTVGNTAVSRSQSLPPSMSLAQQIESVRLAISVSLENL